MADGTNYTLKGFDEYEILLGDALRGERATMGKSLLDVQRDLKIKASYIAAIENCDLGVFSNKGFIAGYVRSYARYLNMDPETVYNQFCSEAGFSNMSGDFNFQIGKYDKKVQKKFGPESNWKPGEIGQVTKNKNKFLSLVSNFSPIFVLLFVIIGTGFGAVTILKEVQKLDVVAVEEAPVEMIEIMQENRNNIILDPGYDVYSSEELTLPVFEPRDKAVSQLESNILTALEDVESSRPKPYRGNLNGLKEVDKLVESHTPFRSFPDPVVRTVPNVPVVKLLAMTPAWVRIKNGYGDVILEKTLTNRETFLIKKDVFNGQLRAGNAQNVYFIIDEEIFGPLSITKSVVKQVSLSPDSIKEKWSLSLDTMATYFKSLNEEDIPLNTAENME